MACVHTPDKWAGSVSGAVKSWSKGFPTKASSDSRGGLSIVKFCFTYKVYTGHTNSKMQLSWNKNC